jgi:hypothetical protein
MFLFSVYALKTQLMAGTIFSEYANTIRSLFMVWFPFWLVRDILIYEKGHTVIKTTEYKLFKCRESGTDETFMMFADNENELEKFFDYSRPDVQVFIEELPMTAKSFEVTTPNEK